MPLGGVAGFQEMQPHDVSRYVVEQDAKVAKIKKILQTASKVVEQLGQLAM